MSSLDEPNPIQDGSESFSEDNSRSREEMERRVRELERENAALKANYATLQSKYQLDRDLLHSLILSDLPRDEAEFQELLADSKPLSDLLREMEARFGLESPK